MKKIMILAAAAALVLSAACTKTEISSPNDEQHAIGFTNYAPKAVTKAGDTYVSGSTLVNGKKFGVYAYANANATPFAGTETPNFMKNQFVNYATGGNTNADVNTYSPTRYWPAGNTPDKLTFYAYYPADVTGITPNVTSGLGSYAFAAANAASNMVDFMVSDVVPNLVYATSGALEDGNAVNGVVPLTFHHMLTRVQFYFKTDKPDSDANTEVKITSATLAGVDTKGTLTPTYNTSTKATSMAWSSLGKETPDAIVYTVVSNLVLTQTAKTPSGTDYAATYPSTSDIYLMVPQNMAAAAQQLTINYTVTTWSGSHTDENKVSETTNSVVVDLYDVKDSSSNRINWAMNRVVTYTFTVGLHPVKFTAEAADWGAETLGAHTVE